MLQAAPGDNENLFFLNQFSPFRKEGEGDLNQVLSDVAVKCLEKIISPLDTLELAKEGEE